MTGYVVYVDQVLVGNLLMNYIILWLTGRLTRVRLRPVRLFTVAGFGSLYSMALFLSPGNQLLSFPVKIAVSIAMVVTAFAPLPLRRLAACLGVFYLASFALGGVVLGFIFFLHSGTGFDAEIKNFMSIVNRYFWPGLSLAVTAWIFTGLAIGRWRRKQSRNVFQVPLTIDLGGKRVTVDALVDTGNALSDPLTGDPVVVVEYEMIEEALPVTVREALARDTDTVAVLSNLAQTTWVHRFRLIPFRSLGQENGLLLGLRPDAVEVCQDGRVTRVERVVVGIYRHRLDCGLAYRALIPPDLLAA